jgi:hypothetical protein
MEQARAHRRLAGTAAFALLTLVAELFGRSLTVRLDLGRHVPTPGYSGTDYYPFLLAAVKVSVALLLAMLTWRVVRARGAARAARSLLAAVGARPADAPRLRIELRPRTWLLSFLTTSCFYLVQTDTEQLTAGRWPLVSPWLHTSALSVFAVLAVGVAVLYEAVARWLSEYERYAGELVAAVRSFFRRLRATPPTFRDCGEHFPPRRLFGLALESRPPPTPA